MITGPSLGRRPFLLGAAGLIGAHALPGRLLAATNTRFDVAVVGGGTTGMPLAIAAAMRGGHVLVVERSPILGGTLDRSTCSTSSANNSFQKKAGIVDSAQAHFEDVMAATDGVADPALVKLWTDNAAGMIDWLASLGVKLRFKDTRPVKPGDTYRQPRIIFPEGYGRGLADALQPVFDKLVASGKIMVMANSRAIELVQDRHGAVTGLVVESNEGGPPQAVSARNVVLAAGGCHGNPALFQSLHGFPLPAAPGYPMDAGDGILLGQSAGGTVRGAEHYVPLFGVVMTDNQQPSMPIDGTQLETTLGTDVTKRGPWEIWLNAKGERFFAEDDATPQAREKALAKQPWHRLWTVHDQSAIDNGSQQMMLWDKTQYLAQFDKSEMFQKADTLAELAVKCGLNPAALQASVQDYNGAIAAGRPDPLGRKVRPGQIAKGPFYSVRYQGWHLLTFAGLTVDGGLRVTRADGSVVPNLYAAGEVLGATALGGSARASGSMCTPALTFGQILGARILKF